MSRALVSNVLHSLDTFWTVVHFGTGVVFAYLCQLNHQPQLAGLRLPGLLIGATALLLGTLDLAYALGQLELQTYSSLRKHLGRPLVTLAWLALLRWLVRARR